MTAPRYVHTATLLPDGKVLIAGGLNANDGSALATAEVYDPASGTWSPTGSMATARYTHEATLLPNGRVLVSGGVDGSGALGDGGGVRPCLGHLERYRLPGRSSRSAHGDGFARRQGAGRGGKQSGLSLSSAEVYDPASGTWSTTGSMALGRGEHTATLLPNGNVLVAGGFNFGSLSYLATAEVYTPATRTWSTTGSMSSARGQHVASLLPDGRVLVAGGVSGARVLAESEVYEPASGLWNATGSMPAPRVLHEATALPDGRVLVTGGFSSEGIALSTAEAYGPLRGTWKVTNSMSEPRRESTRRRCCPMARSSSRGASTRTVPTSRRRNCTTLPRAPGARPGPWPGPELRHTATLLPNGRVLVVGGENSIGSLRTAELYDSGSGTWRRTGSLTAPRSSHWRYRYRTGRSSSWVDWTTSVSLWRPRRCTTRPRAPGARRAPWLRPRLPLGDASAQRKGARRGGRGASGPVATAEVYNPASGIWRATGSMAWPRTTHTMTLLFNGRVLAAGGWSGDRYLETAETYDYRAGTWSATGSMIRPRANHQAEPLLNGGVLVAGGS